MLIIIWITALVKYDLGWSLTAIDVLSHVETQNIANMERVTLFDGTYQRWESSFITESEHKVKPEEDSPE